MAPAPLPKALGLSISDDVVTLSLLPCRSHRPSPLGPRWRGHELPSVCGVAGAAVVPVTVPVGSPSRAPWRWLIRQAQTGMTECRVTRSPGNTCCPECIGAQTEKL